MPQHLLASTWVDKMAGTGTVSVVDGVETLKDSETNIKLSAGLNAGQDTGSATIYFQYAQGLWESFTINDTSPGAVCSCSVQIW